MNIKESQQQIARNIEGYLTDNKLYYGQEARSNGDASWTLALQNYPVSPHQERLLTQEIPSLIASFHYTSEKLLIAALSGSKNDQMLQQLRTYLTAGVSDETRELWQEAAQHGSSIFSTRPDMIITNNGEFKIIEYNTDGGADKGNTQGVNDYARLFLGEKTVGSNLARLFVTQIRKHHQNKEHLLVTTVVPDEYRTEYEAQNRYFAAQADKIGKEQGIRWVVVPISTVQIADSRLRIPLDGKLQPIDVIDREFKLPGFSKGHDFQNETALLKACFAGYADLLGSILPFQDKVLLSTLFDPTYKTIFEAKTHAQQQQLHAESDVIDPDRPSVQLGENMFSFDDISQLRPDFQMVLKRGGDNEGTTGSKGLVLSSDTNETGWKCALQTALTEPLSGGNFWIIQRFYSSTKSPVLHMRNSRSTPKELTVINRFAPYYVRNGQNLELGNILVTAGTDEETYKRGRNNIHGLRQNTYQGVTVKE